MKTIFYLRFASAGIMIMTAACLHSQGINSQGSFSGADFQNVLIAGSSASWSNLSGTQFVDGNNATAGPLASVDSYTDYLRATNFLFSIPDSSVIMGIEVTVYKNSNERPKTRDNIVTIIKNNVIGNDNHAFNASWQAQSNPVIYGSNSDLWGQTWTNTDINSANFGAAISIKRGGGGSNGINISIDAILIKVYYTTADSNVYYGGNSGVSLRMQQQAISFSNDVLLEFDVYPNPSSGDNPIIVDFSNMFSNKKMLVVLSDITGREYYSKVIALSNDEIVEIANSSATLSPGIYFVTAASNDVFFGKKLIVR